MMALRTRRAESPLVRLVSLALLVMAGLAPRNAVAQDNWAQADKDTRRLIPAAFAQVPAKVVAALESRHCMIPQSFSDSTPHNVIRGNFQRGGQVDWAALCSRARASTILIVWGGPTSCPDELEVREDRSYLQKLTGGVIRYTRRIEPVSRDYIQKMYDRFNGERPPPLDHQGINDIFPGKGSTVRYCHEGKWLELTGEQ